MGEMKRGDCFSEMEGVEIAEEGKEQTMLSRKLGGAIAKKKLRKKAMAAAAVEQFVKARGVNKIQPLIIHAVSPPVIHAEPSSFMRVVQSLTGCEATRLRCELEEEQQQARSSRPAATSLQASPLSCSAASPCSSGSTVASTTSAGEHVELVAVVAADRHRDELISGAPPELRMQHEYGSRASLAEMESSVRADPQRSYSGFFSRENDEQACSRREADAAEAAIANLHGSFSSPSPSEADAGSSVSSADSDHTHFFNISGVSSPDYEDNGLYLSDSTLLPQHSQDLDSTVDSFLQHLLYSYDSDPCCTFSSFLLSEDACDSQLLKELS